MKKIVLVFALVMISTFVLMSDPIVVTGKITDLGGKPLVGAMVAVKNGSERAIADRDGKYSIAVPSIRSILVFNLIGYTAKEVTVGHKTVIDVTMGFDVRSLEVVEEQDMMIVEPKKSNVRTKSKSIYYESEASSHVSGAVLRCYTPPATSVPDNAEDYASISENVFRDALKDPLSTFSIDVDAASYSNMRRFINNGQRPPREAVRLEEMINYFNYDYAQPKGSDPFSINTEISSAPWNKQHRLIHIGLQGKDIAVEQLPASNLVFLIDVSGSMSSQNKLPLLKAGFKMLVNKLRKEDNVAVVVYAGAAGLVLPSTSGENKSEIIEALSKLNAGGSTAGGQGINLAYQVAKKNFKKGGNNRIILATDGDFNVGASSNKAMETLIEEKRKEGVFLTVLGFGMGNYKDSKMEVLADKGNGNYAYIDNILEAKKVLVNEFGGTLFTIAKDVKLQVEFNPAKVKAYRLIGYENRVLKHEDFNNDKKDAGELGSGHTVTAMYEVIPVGVQSKFIPVDDLKYQKTTIPTAAYDSEELLTVKFRYKSPDKDISELIVHPVLDRRVSIAKTSNNFRWSAAVASFGMLLRDSDYTNDITYQEVINMANGARGRDLEGYRAEFIRLVKSLELLASN